MLHIISFFKEAFQSLNVEFYLQSVGCTATIDVENENISLVRNDMQGISIDSSLVDTSSVSEEEEL